MTTEKERFDRLVRMSVQDVWWGLRFHLFSQTEITRVREAALREKVRNFCRRCS
jgi:hypothetical protein